MDASSRSASAGLSLPSVSATEELAKPSLYQAILQGFIAHPAAAIFFLCINSLCIGLLGYWRVAGVALVALSGADLGAQWLYRRWIKATIDESSKWPMTRLGLLVFVRNSIAIVGLLYVALVDPAPAATGTLFVMIMASIVVTITQACFSARVLAMAIAPQMAALLVTLLAKYGAAHGSSALLLFACLAVVLWMVAVGAEKARDAFIAAQDEKDAMIRTLEAARDAAQRGEQAKATFLATMSHEIRTPMNGVLGMAQILKNSRLSRAQAAQIDTLIQSGEFLMAILNDILDLSKIEAGQMEASPEASDLPALLRHLAAFWAPRASDKGVAFNVEAAPDLPRHVMLDPVRVRQILFNLVGNALKFTTEGGVKVTACSRPLDDGRAEIHVAVSDTGVGIAPDALPTLFNRFSQVDDSNARKFGGTGLGLAISKQLAEMMDGRIWVESEPGKGSTFHVILPLKAVDAPAEMAPAPPESETTPPILEMLSILAVDDNPVNLSVVTHLLQAVGFQVTAASGGREALEALADQRFDLILMDIQMPEMTGPEVLERMRRSAGPNLDTPAIALTADAMSGGADRYRAQGFHGHVTKPIQPAVLLAAISAAMAEAGPANVAAVA
jgi:signal transduction histidine kinase/CheY-like chemotaxis protein